MAIINKLLQSLRRKPKFQTDNNNNDQQHFNTAPDPPTSSTLPLIPIALPQVLSTHQSTLPHQGWATLLPPPQSLTTTSLALFQSSATFFDLPLAKKEKFKTSHGSEEGWSRIPGEKEMLTLRTLNRTPPQVRDAVAAFWADVGGLLRDQLLGRMAESLGLSSDALTDFVGPGAELGAEKTATMVRLFRYEGCNTDVGEGRVVAEPHSDLGLLSLVLGSTPGLEVWNRDSSSWLLIEQSDPPTAATLLVGRQLERLSNGRYQSGKHRVCAYPSTSAAPSSTNPVTSTLAAANASAHPFEEPQTLPSPTTITAATPEFSLNSLSSSNYRYSIVFVLRAHWPVPVDSSLLTTPITGTFTSPLSNMTAKDLFVSIEKVCFNVNAELKERDKQKRKLYGGRNSKRGSRLIDGDNNDNDEELRSRVKKEESKGTRREPGKGHEDLG